MHVARRTVTNIQNKVHFIMFQGFEEFLSRSELGKM